MGLLSSLFLVKLVAIATDRLSEGGCMVLGLADVFDVPLLLVGNPYIY